MFENDVDARQGNQSHQHRSPSTKCKSNKLLIIIKDRKRPVKTSEEALIIKCELVIELENPNYFIVWPLLREGVHSERTFTKI